MLKTAKETRTPLPTMRWKGQNSATLKGFENQKDVGCPYPLPQTKFQPGSLSEYTQTKNKDDFKPKKVQITASNSLISLIKLIPKV